MLDNGQVLIAGGFTQGYMPVATAELYDPVAGTFTNSSGLVTPRYAHTASLLNNGQVLLTGGIDGSGNTSASSELFNPSSGIFTATGNLHTARNSHTATLLNNGQVLLVGGVDAQGNILSSSELYDPASGAFAFTGVLNTARQEHTATLLNSGLVLITGGVDNNGAVVASAEQYDPSTGTFTKTASLNVGREQHTATLLTNGKVLVAGGLDATSSATPSVELYDPTAGTFTYISVLNVARSQQTATLLNSGNVFLAGGVDQNSNALGTTELYQPDSLVPSGLVSITVNPLNPSLPTGVAQALIATGIFSDTSTQTLASVVWASSDSTIATLTNDASNHGHAFGVGSGNATVNACVGSICGSTSISVGTATSAPPTILSLSPSSGGIGATVTISGAGFGSAQGSSTVTFNGVAAAPSVWNDTQIVVSVPMGATSGNVVVTVQGVASNDVFFTLLASASGAPSISSLSPISGMVGKIVEITGTGFGSSQEAGTVTFNGVPALLAGWTNAQISVMVPSGASTGNVVVTVPSGTSNGVNFTVISLTSIAVNSQTLSLHVDNTAQFSVTGTYSDGSTQDLTSLAAWNSSAPQVATINNSGLATAVGTGQSTIQATIGSLTRTAALTVTSNFTLLSGAMSFARADHTATVLNDGTVLFAGGMGLNLQAVPTAELYNAGAGTFTSTGSLNFPRQTHTATLLNNGTVLVAGGRDASGNIVTSEELYDPVGGAFNVTPAMNSPRYAHTATVLNNGQVLLVGGIDSNGNVLTGAEIYDPTAGVFTATGNLNSARQSHTATLLDNGMVLITGGSAISGSYASGGVLASAELYDPATGLFTYTGALTNARSGHTATLLNDGTVLISGGGANDEVYSFVTGNFSVVDTARFVNPTSTLLNNGQVLILQGAQAPLYDPKAGTLTAAGSMNSNRVGATATLLSSGAVLVAGGYWEGMLNQPLSTAELYSPSSLAPMSLVSISVNPPNPTLPAGTAQSLTAVGTFSDNSTQDIVAATWSSSDTTIAAVTSDSSNRGHVFGLNPGLTTISACTGTVCGSTTITVGPSGANAPPTILSANAIGWLLTISGSGFGTSSSAGIVTINGAVAIPNSYSNTQIIVPLPPQATTLSILVTVAGVPSNLVIISIPSGSVGGSPTIVSLSPAFGPISTPVTITGTNFGSAQESSTVTFNGVLAAPSSWSETKIVTTVPSAATSGNVVVTIGGTTSAGVNFTVAMPTSINVTPANPVGYPNQTVQFMASAIYSNGNVQDVTSAVTWSSSVTETASVSTTGLANLLDVGQTNIQAVLGILTASTNLTVNWSGSAGYTVVPSSLNMFVGDSHQLSAITTSGSVVTGLSWTSSNPSIVEVSAADPPRIIAVAPGTAKIYAGSVPVPVTVYAAGTTLPTGTPIWTLPLAVEGGIQGLTPAVPVAGSNIDMYVRDTSGTLSAITSDGQFVWRTAADGFEKIIPDFSGNLFVTKQAFFQTGSGCYDTHKLYKLDPSSGNLTELYTFSTELNLSYGQEGGNGGCEISPGVYVPVYDDQTYLDSLGGTRLQPVIPHPSGVLFLQDLFSVVVMNARSGQVLASVPLESSSWSITGFATTVESLSPAAAAGNMIVAGDGNAYLPYSFAIGSGFRGEEQGQRTDMLLRISPDGSYAKILLNQQICELPNPPGEDCLAYYALVTNKAPAGLAAVDALSVVTNADQGVAVFLLGQTSLVSRDSLAGQTYNTVASGFLSSLQRGDGSIIGADENRTLSAVTLGGVELWNYTFPYGPNSAANSPDPRYGIYPVEPLYTTADGSVVVRYDDPTYGGLYTFDKGGNLASRTPDDGSVYSWTGNWYQASTTGVQASQSAVQRSSRIRSSTRSMVTNAASPNASSGLSLVQRPLLDLTVAQGTYVGLPVAGYATEMKCFAQLKYRPATTETSPFNHSFWYVKAKTGAEFIAAAGPTGSCLPIDRDRITGCGYLNKYTQVVHNCTKDSYPGAKCVTTNMGVEESTSRPTWFPIADRFSLGDPGSSLFTPTASTATCDNVTNLLRGDTRYPNDTFLYGLPPNFTIGPNSNTFAHYLGEAGGFNVPRPPSTPGWCTDIPGLLYPCE